MNPQDQPNTPTPENTDNGFGTPLTANEPVLSTPVVEQTSSEADAAALQAIDALESEDVAGKEEVPVSSPIPTPTPVPAEPVVTPLSPEATPEVTTPPTDTQAPVIAPVAPIVTKKKSNKLVVILLVVVLIVIAVVAGYFVWQSM